MSRATPESSVTVPDPKRACRTRSPFTKRGASCDASASLYTHERSTVCPGRREDGDCPAPFLLREPNLGDEGVQVPRERLHQLTKSLVVAAVEAPDCEACDVLS